MYDKEGSASNQWGEDRGQKETHSIGWKIDAKSEPQRSFQFLDWSVVVLVTFVRMG
jgi:hypothetical protein